MTPLSPSEVDFMPVLLRSLSILIKLKGKHVSPQFLLAGLAGSEKISAGACLRAAERAGLKGKVMYRPRLDDISPLTLPCILLLKDNASCVLTSIDEEKAGIILPELGESVQSVARRELESQYSGYAVFGALESRADARTDPVELQHGKDWFWSVLRFYMPIYRHVALASVVVNVIAVASSLFVMNVYFLATKEKAVRGKNTEQISFFPSKRLFMSSNRHLLSRYTGYIKNNISKLNIFITYIKIYISCNKQ